MKIFVKSLIVMVMSASTLVAQTATPSGGTAPDADRADVESIDAIIAALYDVISGPAGQERNWDRMRSLFVSEAKLIPTGFPRDGGNARANYMALEDYIERNGPFLVENGFFESEIGRVEERFENIAHVFSTYDSRATKDGDVFARGINSIQLLWDGERWWIANIMWRGVGPEFEIPGKYRN